MKRFTDTDIWDKEWFMKLKAKEKCLVRFIFDKCDCAGIWAPNWALASTYIGEPVSFEDLANFSYRLEFLGGGKIFVPDFVSFQYGTLSEKCKPHIKVIEVLKKHGLLERVSKGYTEPLQRVEEKEEDKDKEEEEEKEEEKESAKIEISEPYPFEGFWEMYGKKVGRADCERKYSKTSQDQRRAIWSHVPRYVDSTPDKRFRKDPETYLNGKHWNDEIIIESKVINGKQTTTISKHDSIRDSVAEALRLNQEDIANFDAEGKGRY